MPIYDLLNPKQYVDNQTYLNRLDTCQKCPHRQNKYQRHTILSTDQCPLCKCIIKLKAKLKTEDCPKHYWE